MGPRSRDRGIEIRESLPKFIELLQWGRDHVIAELGTGGNITTPRPGFNGAAIT